MNDRLVYNSSQILRLLLSGKTNVNSIIKKTSLYKNFVFEANETLKQGRLVAISPDPTHKQRLIVDLTMLGQEFAELISSTDEYNKSYSELIKAIRRNFNIPQDTNKLVLTNTLRSRGWINEEIKLYDIFYDCADYLEDILPTKIIHALILRYILILSKFSINKTAKTILNRIIIDAIPDQLLFILENFEKVSLSRVDKERFDMDRSNFDSDILGTPPMTTIISSLLQEYHLLNNRFIREETKKVLISIFSIIKPSQKYIEEYHKEFKDTLEKLDRTKQPSPDIPLTLKEQTKQLVAFYEEIVSKLA